MKFYQRLHTSKPSSNTKIQLIPSSHLSTASKSSFWTKFCIVKEVHAIKVQMTSNFASIYSFLPHLSMTRIQLHPFNHFSKNITQVSVQKQFLAKLLTSEPPSWF